jgi:hypothetical protein
MSGFTMTQTPIVPSEKAKLRADFMRRLFAVIVSVGFANQLARLPWIEDAHPHFPQAGDWPQIMVLIVSLVLIIQSWEGYFTALEDRPLETLDRFYLDTAIVFSYLVLLTVAHGTAAFLFMIWIIFCLYLIWDYLTFKKYHVCYQRDNGKIGEYLLGLRTAIADPQSPFRSKLFTVMALMWFVEVYIIYLQRKNWSPLFFAIMVLAGLLMYRWATDQARRYPWLGLAVLLVGVFLVYTLIRR